MTKVKIHIGLGTGEKVLFNGTMTHCPREGEFMYFAGREREYLVDRVTHIFEDSQWSVKVYVR